MGQEVRRIGGRRAVRMKAFIEMRGSCTQSSHPSPFSLQTRLSRDCLLTRSCLPLQGLDIALFWRALVQKILVDLHGYWRKDWIVGKIAAKCSDFVQYAHKALSRLSISHDVS